MASNSCAACCRLGFTDGRKSHKKIQSYPVDRVDFSHTRVG